MAEKIAYIYSELPNYIRVKKNINLFAGMFDDVQFIGVNRSGGVFAKSDFPSNVNFSIYEKPIAYGGVRSVFQSFGFARYVLSQLREKRFDTIVFANEELLWVAQFLDYKPKVVCEVLDSLAIRTFGFLSLFNPIFELYCNYFYRKCDSIIEVSEHRMDYRKYNHKQVYVIPNSPVTTTLELELFSELDEIEYIYVSGSVVPGLSGIEELLKAFDSNLLGNLKIVYSGRLIGKWAEKHFFAKDYVINLGSLSPEHSLVVAEKSLAMFAFYKPVNLNFRLASPNKVTDAIMLAKPLLMNSECHAKFLLEKAGLSLSSPYEDVTSLVANIRQLVNGLISVSKNRSKKVYDEYFSESNIKLNWKKALGKNG